MASSVNFKEDGEKMATDLSGQAPGGKRRKLAELLPLDTPMIVEIFPIYSCNFRCIYCLISMPEEERGYISDSISLDFDLYKRCIDDIARFPQKLKVLRFSGIGEPLLHRNIVEMVEYASQKEVAEKIEILTNASLLTPEMSDALVSAGLNRLVVSLQGITREKYREISGIDLDFERFIENLKYFYRNRQGAHIYVKIVDDVLSSEEDRKRFFDLFGPICDSLAIEHVVPIQEPVDYTNVLHAKDKNVTQFGLTVGEAKICPQPFFKFHILPDGKVVPCHAYKYPAIMGDCNTDSVREIWNSSEYKSFQRAMLDGVECASGVCAECSIYKFRQFPEDLLDNDAERLKSFYE
jgi:radical SAM protein with 4Fe4S-binding SPASM domain